MVEKLRYTVNSKLPAVEEARQAAVEVTQLVEGEMHRAMADKREAEKERNRMRRELQQAQES